jgi:dihydrolipoamide dehydrogenase
MPENAYDCIVIGSGPGGYVAAIRAAQLGLKTAVVEKGDIGGRCLNVACIPAKAVLRVADIMSEVAEAREFGVETNGSGVDFAKVGDRRRRVVKTLTGGVAGLLKKNQVDVIEGHGSVTADGNVKVGDTEIEARKAVILATGSVPKPLPGIEFGGRVIGTEEAWALDELPRSLAILGAGASGSELASAYGRLGTDVLLFEALDGCCRWKTRTSRRRRAARWRSRTSRSTRARSSRTSSPVTIPCRSPSATTRRTWTSS